MPRVTQDVIAEAVRLLREAAQPLRIIVFGSQARGDAGEDSDIDLLVVEKELPDRHAEMVRLRDALRPLRIPIDVLVATEEHLRDWGGVPGTVFHEALTEGRVVYDAT
ncbi:MAG: nucleotidyltransferase domain-containing protein [Armatimonadetes bacterium]|nr:nucleotidyltransferase domain-containing protein [Armatimonadota bacterium]